ncbi:MAG: 5'-nucleotidase C-terminal domain-containing protein [Pelistega sp.]|nr:5'-nucleotidase C-terminal domain-containing protein [Pelistega sp.]
MNFKFQPMLYCFQATPSFSQARLDHKHMVSGVTSGLAALAFAVLSPLALAQTTQNPQATQATQTAQASQSTHGHQASTDQLLAPLVIADNPHPFQAFTVNPKNLHLKLLHINDHHSMLEASPLQIKIRVPNSDELKTVSVELGGIARIKTAIDDITQDLLQAREHIDEPTQANTKAHTQATTQANTQAAMSSNALRHKNTPSNTPDDKSNALPGVKRNNPYEVLKLHAGDALTGSLYYTLIQGKADADLMNLICFDAMVLGNHEFDEGDLALANFIEALHLSPDCQTAILSANLEPGDKSPLQQFPIKPYQLYEKGGEQVAVIGISSTIATMHASRPDPGTILSNELVILRELVQKLKQQGITRIILLSHMGYDEDKRMAQVIPELDVIVGGHSHSLLGPEQLKEYGLAPQGEYPTRLSNIDGDLVCIVQAWQYSAVLGELDIVFGPDGKLLSCEGQPHLLIGDEFHSKGVKLSDERNQVVLQDLARTKAWRITEKSAQAERLLQPYREQIQAFANQDVAHAEVNFCSRRVPGSTRDQVASTIADCEQDTQLQNHGGAIQQLVAYAFLEQGQKFGGADIAIVNGGGVRTDVAAGSVTVGTVYQVLPFRNTLVRVQMTGHELKRVVEEALSAVYLGSTGSYPYAANLRWHVNMKAGHGKKLTQLEIKNAQNEWMPLDLERTYAVVTSDFLADGKDGYRTFSLIEAEKKANTYVVYADAFLRYVQSHTKLAKLPTSDYSTQSFIDR